MTKPLLSPLLLPEAPQRPVTPKKPPAPSTGCYAHIITPSNSQGIKRLFSSLKRTQKTSPTYRLIKRKIQKGIKIYNSVNITCNRQIGYLQQQIDDLKPRRQKRVQPDPNKSFITVIEVDLARRQLDAQLLGTEEAGIIDLWNIEISDSEAIALQLSSV